MKDRFDDEMEAEFGGFVKSKKKVKKNIAVDERKDQKRYKEKHRVKKEKGFLEEEDSISFY